MNRPGTPEASPGTPSPGIGTPNWYLGRESGPGTASVTSGYRPFVPDKGGQEAAPPPSSELVNDYLKQKYAAPSLKTFDSKVKPITDWFATRLPDNLMFSTWQVYECKKCGETLAGDKNDSVLKMTMEMHVLRHQLAGDPDPLEDIKSSTEHSAVTPPPPKEESSNIAGL